MPQTVKSDDSAKQIAETGKLKDFKSYFSEYRDFKVYGAMACLQEVQGAFKLARGEGLYVIRAAGKNAVIKKPPGFCTQRIQPQKNLLFQQISSSV